jgi:hypothetical protein
MSGRSRVHSDHFRIQSIQQKRAVTATVSSRKSNRYQGSFVTNQSTTLQLFSAPNRTLHPAGEMNKSLCILTTTATSYGKAY